MDGESGAKMAVKKDKPDQEQSLSPSAMRRMREKEQRYETLLRAAEYLFVHRGYHETSVENIADRAEVSVGTVYFYFKNKEELLLKLFSEGVHTLRVILGQAFLKAKKPEEGFQAAGIAFFDEFCKKHPGKVAIVFKEAVGQSRLLEEARRVMLQKLTDDVYAALLIVSKALGIVYSNPRTAQVVAVGILGIYERVAYQYLMWADDHDKKDLGTIGRDAVNFIMGGLSKFKA
jgi:AcrR family transcriptional regulator